MAPGWKGCIQIRREQDGLMEGHPNIARVVKEWLTQTWIIIDVSTTFHPTVVPMGKGLKSNVFVSEVTGLIYSMNGWRS